MDQNKVIDCLDSIWTVTEKNLPSCFSDWEEKNCKCPPCVAIEILEIQFGLLAKELNIPYGD